MIKSQSQAQPLPLQAAARDPGVRQAERRVPADDRGSFVSTLIERHRNSLMRYLTGLLSSREDAEDVVQETCRRLLEVPELDRTGNRARAYMFRIATHLACDRFRRRPAESLERDGHDAALFDARQQPEAIVGFEQGFEIVREALLELRPRCRQVFLLRISQGLRYEAIAELLDISKRTVEREVKHALDTCQERLQR